MDLLRPLLLKNGRVNEADVALYKSKLDQCLHEAGSDRDQLLAAPERVWRGMVHR